MKACLFRHVNFTETINHLWQNVYGEKLSIIEGHDNVVGSHYNCLICLFQCIKTTYATERNKENYFEIYTNQTSC